MQLLNSTQKALEIHNARNTKCRKLLRSTWAPKTAQMHETETLEIRIFRNSSILSWEKKKCFWNLRWEIRQMLTVFDEFRLVEFRNENRNKSKKQRKPQIRKRKKKRRRKTKNESFWLIGGGGEIDKIVNSRELRECLTCALTCASLSLSLFLSLCFLCFLFIFLLLFIFWVLTVYFFFFLFFLAPKLFFVVVLTSQQLKSWGWRWVWSVFCIFNWK